MRKKGGKNPGTGLGGGGGGREPEYAICCLKPKLHVARYRWVVR